MNDADVSLSVEAANNQINKTWSKTLPCNKSATQVMAAVQNDMGQFVDNQGNFFAANFPSQPITMGGQYSIQAGVMTYMGSAAGAAPGSAAASAGNMTFARNLVVSVTSESANGWTFTTDPSQHVFDGTVSFSSTDAGNGNVAFSITANVNYSNLFWAALGSVIKAGENSTWNNMLSNVQGYCASPSGK